MTCHLLVWTNLKQNIHYTNVYTCTDLQQVSSKCILIIKITSDASNINEVQIPRISGRYCLHHYGMKSLIGHKMYIQQWGPTQKQDGAPKSHLPACCLTYVQTYPNIPQLHVICFPAGLIRLSVTHWWVERTPCLAWIPSVNWCVSQPKKLYNFL
jgi:hypothetical protein